MSSIFERIGRFRQQLGDLSSAQSVSERIQSLRENLEQTQRVLMDGAQHGALNHSRTVAQWYARLELPMDAPEAEVTRSFRRLIRLYHPDLYSADSEMVAHANELTQALVAAHNGLIQHLGGSSTSYR